MFRLLLPAILLSLVPAGSARACPCAGNAGYKYYYVIVNSGPDQAKVAEAAGQVAKQTGHRLLSFDQPYKARMQACEAKPTECLLLFSSDDEQIGTAPANGKAAVKIFAAGYLFASYKTEKNFKNAVNLRSKLGKTAKDAYLKSFDACACE